MKNLLLSITALIGLNSCSDSTIEKLIDKNIKSPEAQSFIKDKGESKMSQYFNESKSTYPLDSATFLLFNLCYQKGNPDFMKATKQTIFKLGSMKDSEITSILQEPLTGKHIFINEFYRFLRDINPNLKLSELFGNQSNGLINQSDAQVLAYLQDQIPLVFDLVETKYYCFKEKGIEILTDEQDIIESITLFSEGKSNYRQYTDDLPLGLTFTDTKESCRNKFGKPKTTFDGSKQFNIQCQDAWNGISITYNTSDPSNQLATISSITISKKKNN